MKFVDFTRDGDVVTGILEDTREVVLSWEYIEKHKPQIGDEYEEVSEEKVISEEKPKAVKKKAATETIE